MHSQSISTISKSSKLTVNQVRWRTFALAAQAPIVIRLEFRSLEEAARRLHGGGLAVAGLGRHLLPALPEADVGGTPLDGPRSLAAGTLALGGRGGFVAP